MRWPWTDKKDSDSSYHDDESVESVEIGGIVVKLDPEQSVLFRSGQDEIDEKRESIFNSGTEKVDFFQTNLHEIIEARSGRLEEIAKQASETPEILELVGMLQQFRESRQEIVAQREQDIAQAFEEAAAKIQSAEERASAKLETLRKKLLNDVHGELEKIRERFSQEAENKEKSLNSEFCEIVENIERKEGDTFHEMVQSSQTDLKRIADIYQQQVSLLFSLVTADRLEKIRTASSIQDFDIRLSKQTSQNQGDIPDKNESTDEENFAKPETESEN